MTNKIFLLILGISIPLILIIGGMIFGVLYLFTPDQGITPVQTLDSISLATAVAQTVEAELTIQAAVPTATATSTPEPTTSPEPTQTLTPTINITTNTAVPPTLITPTFTPITTVCDQAQFVRDVSVQDNTLMSPGSSFVKTWRLKNIGHCTWTTDYKLVFHSGDAMDANQSINQSITLPKSVEPNQTIDLSVLMRAPQKQGTYRGDWMLSNPSGSRFGIGSSGDQTFWVQIRVVNLANPNLDYDFAANYCRAEWSSGNGKLPCPGTSSSSDGFVVLLDQPELENRIENELALWTHPNNNGFGWIKGEYPEFTIQPNHHFRAWVGCLDDSKGCNVVFRLEFENLKNGLVRTLGSWSEVYDGEVTKIDLDLSQHAGKLVRFILTVEVSGGDPARANAFWFVPAIVKVSGATPTPSLLPPISTDLPTETPMPTETPLPTETPMPTDTPMPTETP